MIRQGVGPHPKHPLLTTRIRLSKHNCVKLAGEFTPDALQTNFGTHTQDCGRWWAVPETLAQAGKSPVRWLYRKQPVASYIAIEHARRVFTQVQSEAHFGAVEDARK